MFTERIALLFRLLGSTGAKAVCRTLMKLTPWDALHASDPLWDVTLHNNEDLLCFDLLLFVTWSSCNESVWWISIFRIFVYQTGMDSFTIVQLRGDSGDHWQSFQDEICQTLGFPKSSRLKMFLAEVNAEITSPRQLQSNDKIVVQSF